MIKNNSHCYLHKNCGNVFRISKFFCSHSPCNYHDSLFINFLFLSNRRRNYSLKKIPCLAISSFNTKIQHRLGTQICDVSMKVCMERKMQTVSSSSSSLDSLFLEETGDTFGSSCGFLSCQIFFRQWQRLLWLKMIK